MKGDLPFAASAALLAAALALGGAGENFPLLEMVLELVALAAAAAFWWRAPSGQLPTLNRWALTLLGGILVLPIVQLIPLPPSVWQALPGRELAAQVDAGLGLSLWRPLTLDVEGTLRALISLVPAAVLFLCCLWLRTSERMQLVAILAMFAFVNAILGIVQLASGGMMTPYPSAHIGYPLGLFVNRNHNAAFLLLSMPAIAALSASRAGTSASRLALTVTTLAFLTIVAVVVVATTSRMGLLLLPVAFAGALIILFFRQSAWRTAIPAALVLGAIAAIMSWLGGFSRNLARFSSLHDARLDYWNDLRWALDHYGLAGTGFGTFVPVYQTAESLSGVSPEILNHAHNDFIEIVLEGGIPAIALLVMFFILLAFAARRLVNRPFAMNRALLGLAAAFGILLVLVFSLVDYPLRMPAMSCAFALLCACLFPSPAMGEEGIGSRATAMPNAAALSLYGGRSIGAALVAVLAVVVIQAGASRSRILVDQDQSALAWARWSTAAHDGVASEALGAMRPKEAMDEALSALRLSPIDVSALRTAAMVKMVQGSPRASAILMEKAAALGWRDPLTQLWAIAASEQAREPRTAVRRGEALFQQQLYPAPAIALLVRDAPAALELGRTLEEKPAWRPGFISAAARLPPADLQKLELLVSRLDASDAPLSIDEAQPLLDRLIALGEIGTARQLWTGTHRNGLIANGGFEEMSSRGGADVPSDWDISDEDLSTIAVQAPPFGGAGLALRISATARSGPILSQQLMLPPGSYVLAYRARSGPGGSVALRWDLRCTSSNEGQSVNGTPASDKAWQQFALRFTVPVQDCPIQRLALQRPDDIHAKEIWLDRLVLKPGR